MPPFPRKPASRHVATRHLGSEARDLPVGSPPHDVSCPGASNGRSAGNIMLSCGHSASPIDSTRRRALVSCVTVHWTNMRSIGPALHSEALLSPPSLLPLPPTSINLRALLRVACFRRIARLARSLVFCVSAVSSAARASYLVLGPERSPLLGSKGQRGFRREHEIPELPNSNIVRSE